MMPLTSVAMRACMWCISGQFQSTRADRDVPRNTVVRRRATLSEEHLIVTFSKTKIPGQKILYVWCAARDSDK
jgi:hypothetical protein